MNGKLLTSVFLTLTSTSFNLPGTEIQMLVISLDSNIPLTSHYNLPADISKIQSFFCHLPPQLKTPLHFLIDSIAMIGR